MERVILHIDMNNFYASVECMLNPSLRDKCVAVCGSVEDRSGIVLAKNYGAKDLGVKTGEPIWQAKQKCPHLVVVPPTYEQYIKFSRLAKGIYSRYTDLIESYGMDECWIDVTKSGIFGSGFDIADKIRKTVTFELGLTVSIGVSFNKVFAKLGSDMKKPDAVTCITKESFQTQVWPLEAHALLGVGRATKKVLQDCGIHTIGGIAKASDSILKSKLGKNGITLKRYANGEDNSSVAHEHFILPAKSIGHGITTMQDLESNVEVWKVLLELVQDVSRKLRLCKQKARGVSLSVKNNQLYSRGWQCKLPYPTLNASFIAECAFALFCKNYTWDYDVRALSICAIDLVEDGIPIQHSLFTDVGAVVKREKLEKATAKIRERFGKHAIRNAVLLSDMKVVKETECLITMPTGMLKQE